MRLMPESERKCPLTFPFWMQMVSPKQLQELRKRGVKQLEDTLISKKEEFECSICFISIEPGEGVTLSGCSHLFCE